MHNVGKTIPKNILNKKMYYKFVFLALTQGLCYTS